MADLVLKEKQCVLGKVILKQEKVSEQDIIAQIQDQKQKHVIGHVGNGKMRLEEFTDVTITEGRMVWRKMGNTIKRAVRCTSGRRKGRVVSNVSQCSATIDFKKRLTLKRTKARMGTRMARRAQRTKKFNPNSRRLRTMNKRRR